MSTEEKDKNKRNKNQLDKDNEFIIMEQNNSMLDLCDEDTLNISLEDKKPLFTKLYTSVVEKITSIKKEKDDEFLTNFEKLFKNQIDLINLCVKNNEPNFIYATNVLMAIIKIFSFFNTKYLEEFLSQSDDESSKVLGLINDNMSDTIDKLANIIFKLGKQSKQINNEIIDLQKNNNIYETYIKQLEDENNYLKEKYNKINQENEFITKKLINNSFSTEQREQINESLKKNINFDSAKKREPKNIKSISSQNYKAEENNKNNFNNKRNNKDKNKNINVSKNYIHDNASLANLSLAGNRVFTLKMMKEIISNVYSSKIIFDQKCLQNKKPKQTMEEFMYTYLNQKYGLKNMVMEWATNIINGIRTFSSEDTEISLFGKILQNELEEQCQIIISSIKENINAILLNILRVEYPFKNANELEKMKNDYIKKEIPLDKTKQIIESLYDDETKKIILDKISEVISGRKSEMPNTIQKNGKITRKELNQLIAKKQDEFNFIQYDYLIDICLQHQIKMHIKYLKPFVKLFKSIDSNQAGFLKEDQFIELIKKMNIFGEENIQKIVQEYLNIIDPYQYGRITFSDTVDLFSKINYDETQTILDKICNQDNINSIISEENTNDNDKDNFDEKKTKKINEDIISKK